MLVNWNYVPGWQGHGGAQLSHSVQLQKKGRGLIKHSQPETKYSYMHVSVSYCTSLISIFTPTSQKFVANFINDNVLLLAYAYLTKSRAAMLTTWVSMIKKIRSHSWIYCILNQKYAELTIDSCKAIFF